MNADGRSALTGTHQISGDASAFRARIGNIVDLDAVARLHAGFLHFERRRAIVIVQMDQFGIRRGRQ